MRLFTSLSLAWLLLAPLIVSGTVAAQELTPFQIYAQAAPAVVFIAGYGPGQKGNGGTGSVIDPAGLVLTNAHVVIEEGTQQPYPQVAVYFKPERVTGIQRWSAGAVLDVREGHFQN